MHTKVLPGLIVLALLASPILINAANCPKLPAGEAEVLYEFVDPDPSQSACPESIAFDQAGNMYITLRTKTAAGYIANEILKLTPSGEESVLADLGPAAPVGLGALGLETDPMGNVYVAFVSLNEHHGVWQIHPDGTMVRMGGSENIKCPDGLAIDRQGNLYVTDYDPLLQGTAQVWKYSRKTGMFAPWASTPLLVGGLDPMGNPMGGANGIVFDPPNHIYVTNTQKSLIVHIPVMNDGSAGEVALLAAGPPVVNPDGLAVDALGNVYAVIPVSTFPDWFWELFGGKPPVTPVVRINPETGEVQFVLAPDFPSLDYFDFPTSLAFGKGPWDHKSVYVVGLGAANFGMPFGSVPKLTQVGVGIPGQTGQ